MTTANNSAAGALAANTLATTPKAITPKKPARFRLPDIPEKHPDDMTSFNHLSINGNAYHLAVRLGNQATTIVSGEFYMCREPGSAIRYPDLLVAFNADPALYKANNGYIISEQGKPPDFVLEIASRRTGHVDIGAKREYYEELGIPEYWRFDETGEFHGAKLACDLLVDGRYEPAVIEELPGGALRGYSAALKLYLHWEDGQLAFYDPETSAPIDTMESERARADREALTRLSAEARAEYAEARIRELEAELRRQSQPDE